MIGSNNYLGLTMHPKVKEAARKGLEEFGPSCTGSRFLMVRSNFTMSSKSALPLLLEKKLPWFFDRHAD